MHHRFCTLFLLLCLFSSKSKAQEFASPAIIECYKGEFKGTTIISALSRASNSRQIPASQIDVVYNDFPAQAKEAFERAVQVWENYIVSSVPIKIKANWSGDLSNLTLAQSSASRIVSNFDNAPYKDVWYVIPLAEALAGKDLNSGDFDITITLNKNIKWAYNSDQGINSDEYDLASIALHEIAHGLGFSSSFKESGNKEGAWGQSGFAYIFDLFIETGSQIKIVNTATIGNPSVELFQYMTGNDLYFDIFDETLNTERPKLQSYSPFQAGKSISHLDEVIYPNGDINSLMTPNIGPAEIIQDPGIRALSVLEQIGWTVRNISAERPLSSEKNDQFQLILYPNPTFNKLTVYAPAAWQGKEYSYSIYNVSGVKLLESNPREILTETTFDINFENFNPGSYIFQAQVGSNTISKKIIKL